LKKFLKSDLEDNEIADVERVQAEPPFNKAGRLSEQAAEPV